MYYCAHTRYVPVYFILPPSGSITHRNQRFYNLTSANSVVQRPSPAADIFPASHEFPSKLWNRMVHFLHNSQLAIFLHPVPDKSNPYTSFHSLNIRFNITLQSSPRASGWPPPTRFPHQIFVCISPLLHACHIPRPSYSS